MNPLTYFAPFPGAFHAADPGLATLIKVPLSTRGRAPNAHDTENEVPFLKEFVLIDFREFPDTLDTGKAIKDCQLVSELLQAHPDEIRELIQNVKSAALGRGGQEKIREILYQIDFTESSFVERGGGFLWLLIVLLAASCGHVMPYANRR